MNKGFGLNCIVMLVVESMVGFVKREIDGKLCILVGVGEIVDCIVLVVYFWF